MIAPCHFFKFYLIVTGVGEEKHLHKLFSSLSATGICSFQIAGRIGQLDPITSRKREVKMVGRGKLLPDKDVQKIGLPARNCVNSDRNGCSYVILIDDLEHGRRKDVDKIFERYRKALDVGLGPNRHRGSVHFLVNMLEAYFFADFQATNAALSISPPLEEYAGDVEQIRNPKADLRRTLSKYNEISDAGKVLDDINLAKILADRDNCAWLRSCAKWVVEALEKYPDSSAMGFPGIRATYHLDDGVVSELTSGQ